MIPIFPRTVKPAARFLRQITANLITIHRAGPPWLGDSPAPVCNYRAEAAVVAVDRRSLACVLW